MARLTPNEIQAKLMTDHLYFPNVIVGIKPWSIQRKIIKYVMNLDNKFYNRTCVRSCHGIGKSFISANIALQFLYTYKPSIVISTAPTFRQVEKVIWKEIRRSYNNTNIDLGGVLQDGAPNLQIVKDEWYAMGFTTNDGDKFQGLHAENILVIVDEAAGITDAMYDAIEGLMTSANARLLLIGNPTSVAGKFKKAFAEKGWNKVAVSAFDTPNLKYHNLTKEDYISGEWEEKFKKGNEKIIIPSLVTPQWVGDKFDRFGINSIYWRTRVEGTFDEEGSDSIVPLFWIETAIERNHELDCESTCNMGLDVAELGRDSTNIAIRSGRKAVLQKQFQKLKLMETVGRVVLIYNEYHVDYINVDVIGIGSGVEGRLSELGVKTHRVNSSEKPGGIEYENKRENNDYKFKNKRTQIYWNLRELLNPENKNAIGLPDDDELIEELMATKYKIDSSGKIQIIAKDLIKSTIGRSPDKADAWAMAFAPDDIFKEGKEKKRAGVW